MRAFVASIARDVAGRGGRDREHADPEQQDELRRVRQRRSPDEEPDGKERGRAGAAIATAMNGSVDIHDAIHVLAMSGVVNEDWPLGEMLFG